MTLLTSPVSAEQWLALAADHAPCELIAGEFRQMLPDGPEHAAVVQRLAARLAAHAEAQKLGLVFEATTGFVLRRNPDTVSVADVAFVSHEVPPCPTTPYALVERAPDLAIEVVAPGQRRAGVDAKAACWIEHGSRMAWVVDPQARTIAVLRGGATARVIAPDEVVTGDEVVPGFRCRIDDLLA